MHILLLPPGYLFSGSMYLCSLWQIPDCSIFPWLMPVFMLPSHFLSSLVLVFLSCSYTLLFAQLITHGKTLLTSTHVLNMSRQQNSQDRNRKYRLLLLNSGGSHGLPANQRYQVASAFEHEILHVLVRMASGLLYFACNPR